MCGRFTQNYTWEEVYAFLKVFGTPRNLRPHYNIAPTTNVDVIRLNREGRARAGLDALGPGTVFLEKKPEGGAGDVQRARRDDRRKADVPRLLQAPTLHYSGERIFRVDQ